MFCFGRTAKRQPDQGAVPHDYGCPRVLDFFCFAASARVLAEKRLAEVGQVVSQGAPQRHTFDFVEATYGQRRQPAIGS
jgi:hypothetical protein